MAKPARVIVFLIHKDQLRDANTLGVLDMLRYDAARVLNNAPEPYVMFETNADPGGPTFARWKSYGIDIAWHGRPAERSIGELHAREWAHAAHVEARR